MEVVGRGVGVVGLKVGRLVGQVVGRGVGVVGTTVGFTVGIGEGRGVSSDSFLCFVEEIKVAMSDL